MAISLLNFLAERSRQGLTQDDRYFKRFLFFFELKAPKQVLTAGSVVFPLIIPPESYSMEEVFTVEATKVQGGGLYVEENGIIERPIRIRGTTGFKPRKFPVRDFLPPIMRQNQKSWSRNLPIPVGGASYSGHRHFQYLQDVIFRTYGDMKRDPSMAQETQLILHVPKEQESWVVVPQRFRLERQAGKSPLYYYDIELIAVDRAEASDGDFSEDKALLDSLKDKIGTIKKGLDLAAGAVNDLTALTSELSSLVKDFAKIIDGASTVIDAGTNLTAGVTALIESPLALLSSVQGLVDAAASTWEANEQAVADIVKLPETVKQKFRQIGDAMDMIGTHPEAFEKPADKQMRDNKKKQELLLSTSPAERSAASLAAAPSSLAASSALGTSMTAGDVTSAQGEFTVGREVRQYTSTTDVTITQGDTLVSLASRYLGDARLWQHIAVVNGLKPPFVNDLASTPLTSEDTSLPGVLRIGQKVLIPTYQLPPQSQPLLPVLGVPTESPVEEHLLGVDLALEPMGGREGSYLYDIPIDTEAGSIDAKVVRGVKNMRQAVIVRLVTEKGTDQLYRNVGVERIVSLNVVPADLELARFRLRSALEADPRVGSARKIDLQAADDALSTDVELELRGFTQSTNIRAALR